MSKESQRIGTSVNYKLWRDDNHAVCINGKKIKINYGCIIYMKILLQMDWCLMIGIMFTSSAKDYQTGKTRLVNIKFTIVSPRYKRGLGWGKINI